jgi:hypothetical protein
MKPAAVLFVGTFILLNNACSRKVTIVPGDPTRESVIEDIKSWSPKILADAEKEDPAFKAWADAQVSGVCFVHHIKMRRKWVPVSYGLPMMTDMPTKEEAYTSFPLADEGFWLGGCVVGPVKEREMHVCDQCTAAYRAWKTEHQKREPNQQRPEHNAGAASPSTSTSTPGVAHL